MSLAEQFARWSATVCLAEVPSEIRAQALRAMLDVTGVMVAGSRHPMVESMRRVFSGTPGSSTVVGGSRTTSSSAALINGAAAHVWDFDDTSYSGILHGSAVVFPAVLAAVEERAASDEDVLAAFIAGSELAYTLGEVLSHSHYFKGWWSTATLGLIGATAGVARAYRLDVASTTNAIAMAAAGAGGTKCLFGTDSKPFFVGETARRAIDIANAAAAKLTGPIDAFEDARGFCSLLNGGQARFEFAETLGRRWRLLDPGLLFKVNPVCSAAQAAIEAVSTLMRASGADISQIDRIHCSIPELVKISLVFDRPNSPQEAQFSLPYAIACAVLHGRVKLQDLSSAEVAAPLKRSMMERVVHEVSQELSSNAMRARYPEGARITLTLSSGERLQEFCAEAYGMPGRPASDTHLWEKFVECAAFAGVPERELGAAQVFLGARVREPTSIRGIVSSIFERVPPHGAGAHGCRTW